MAVTYSTLVPTSEKFIDLTGRKFGRLTANIPLNKFGSTAAHWLCECDCGGSAIVIAHRLLKDGGTKSCGCLQRERFNNKSHGKARTPVYITWVGMKSRCSNPKHSNYRLYGGRGIKFCSEWAVFANFLADMGDRPEGCELDRIDPDGDYTKENCRWVSHKDNVNNTRSNRLLLIGGSSYTLAQASRKYGISVGTIWQRIHRGWPEELAATQPLHSTLSRTQQ